MVDKDFKELNLYPIDYPFITLVENIKKGQLVLDPEFQRKYKRDQDGNARTSKFIESALMKIPLPVCYFRETEEKTYYVIDGVQRLTTIKNFFEDKFALTDLLVFEELNGKTFSELPQSFQRDLENYTMRCIILRKNNPEYIVNDIFARLNQGGVVLSPQEIRNALYNGPFNHLLKDLASKISHLGGVNQKSLGYEQLVLRFFAMSGDLHDYDDKMDIYLDKFMKDHQDISQEQISEYSDLFLNTLNKCYAVFGKSSFINPNSQKKKHSIVYYDLLMWSFKTMPLPSIEEKKSSIIDAFSKLCMDEEFKKTIQGGLGQKSGILKRRKLWSYYLEIALKNNAE